MGVQIAFDFGSQASRPEAVSPPTDAPGSTLAGVAPAASTGPTRGRTEHEPPVEVAQGRLWSRGQLEAVLRAETGLPLALTLTDNGRTMISYRREAGEVQVRLHHMFLQAGPEVVQAVAGYLAKTAPNAGETLGRFIEANRGRIRRSQARRIQVRPAGDHHDLRAIYDQLNHRYFDGRVQARITWSRRSRPRGAGEGATRGSIKLGSYASGDQLIRIHPVLDADWVPEYFVAFIVYHEMLHQVVPPERRGGRRGFHGPDFRERERCFEHYARALAWERRYLRRLLRS